MEQRFFFGLLMLGENGLALYYFTFCLVASLGALQFVAGKYARRDLTPLSARVAHIIGVALVALAFVWFFSARADLFIPGLAGGEFVAYAFAAFVAAFLLTRAVVWTWARAANMALPLKPRETESK